MFDSRDKGLIADLQGRLDTVEPGADVLHGLMDGLREGLRAERMVAYGVELAPDHYAASFCHSAGFPQPQGELLGTLNGFLRQQPNPWGYFDPARPAAAQRNRALHFRPHEETETRETPLHDLKAGAWRRLGIGPTEEARVRERVTGGTVTLYRQLKMEHMFQLRALVCEGSTLLAWVGALRSEPFTPREQRLLQELVPSLQRRLELETRLREAGLLGSALEAALEALGQPAYVLSSKGRVVYANSAGRALAERASPSLAEIIRRHGQGEPPPPGTSVTALQVRGLSPHYLVVDRSTEAQASARVHVLASRWGLTVREAEVLEHIIQGTSNKAIAARLGCAERTVEVHVTHVLSKAQVESRSALIAKFFQAT
ncbi:LuxR family transcriptional regulator [Hyalangium minutum]|uniref:Transcriptional regulator, LuxR family protein n=1 Tax=Hyalangium minutum TaxID=394096 RepID=A0A085W3M6_9BACT|nr:LuxR family transcriptional regulator [Hyalangium minutum]KFE62289.1 Transcriptional regulator, LuxR family protein [Hyalangium minutum]